MNIQSHNIISSEHSNEGRSILYLCARLAELEGFNDLAEKLERHEPEVEAAAATLIQSVAETARSEGFRTTLQRVTPEQVGQLLLHQSFIVETKDHRFLLVTQEKQSENKEQRINLISLDNAGNEHIEVAEIQNLVELWTEQILYFKKINTALLCFSLVAREYKIELTQERLRHEFSLTYEEIPTDTFLRMCKNVGIKARLLKLNWQKITQLKSAYPAIARLKNGSHLIVVGIVPDESTAEVQLACYDPLGGTKGSHVRLNHEEFERQWAGEVYVMKRAYGLTDESQPFSLRWFMPEIFRQKTAFFDVALAVLFIHVIALITPIFFSDRHRQGTGQSGLHNLACSRGGDGLRPCDQCES